MSSEVRCEIRSTAFEGIKERSLGRGVYGVVTVGCDELNC